MEYNVQVDVPTTLSIAITLPPAPILPPRPPPLPPFPPLINRITGVATSTTVVGLSFSHTDTTVEVSGLVPGDVVFPYSFDFLPNQGAIYRMNAPPNQIIEITVTVSFTYGGPDTISIFVKYNWEIKNAELIFLVNTRG